MFSPPHSHLFKSSTLHLNQQQVLNVSQHFMVSDLIIMCLYSVAAQKKRKKMYKKTDQRTKEQHQLLNGKENGFR